MPRKRLAPLLKRRHLSLLPFNLLSKTSNASRKAQQWLHVSRVRQPITTQANFQDFIFYRSKFGLWDSSWEN